MNKYVKYIFLIGTVALLMTACAAPAAQPTPPPAATSTPEPVITSTPIIIVVTATPQPATATQEIPTATIAPATNTPEPTKTYATTVPGALNGEGTPIKSDSSIVITKIKETSSGQGQIFWTANGTFEKGFRIYYSSYIKVPVFGGEKSEYAIPDGTTRSAFISGTPGTTYYYRLCNYTGSGCASYSAVYTFTFSGPTSTP